MTVKVNGTNNEIFLSVRAYKIKATKYADLTWSGANSENVDIYRDGTYITTTENDGTYTDGPLGKLTKSATYKVCEEGTTACSNSVTVTW